MGQILTSNKSLIETSCVKTRLEGLKCYLRIDQSSNIDNGEGEASILLDSIQVKELISLLNDYIVYVEGKPFVVLSEPLLHESVKIMVNDREVKKIPNQVNPYLSIENTTPGGIDYDNYFKSIQP